MEGLIHMKILMISPQPFFEPRGTPISVYQRLEALSALGHEIDLVTSRPVITLYSAQFLKKNVNATILGYE